ncbi:Putative flippase GtrA (transmembrane translocase of bactoprenol-linked glucose) [Acetitomaculum ruminis DSM 5522]|uniref:Putative flippase GtrA (Transmembrane translocase of bactoprenol-linked glucose) n=1 Tax=Acetitomaculum ruminis DSM 5522 TaxID=1120918 RepID=A0A1I0UYH4_9FIRM|nr:GtrA family protein [Acetitomaculum ruminis]SFA68910.1 Putative flippase GtrA (transmembrane translocase of bactoprenol-linked glucose) [Acetitomaculum ruminis DSM 5522]
MKKLIEQILKFGAVGFLCFFIDYGIMVLLKEVFGVNYLVAATISFVVSVIFNYVLSITFVFVADKNANKFKEMVIFVIFSAIGLLLNDAIMWGLDKVGVFYMLSKIVATGIVMVYNFITRKLFIEKR